MKWSVVERFLCGNVKKKIFFKSFPVKLCIFSASICKWKIHFSIKGHSFSPRSNFSNTPVLFIYTHMYVYVSTHFRLKALKIFLTLTDADIFYFTYFCFLMILKWDWLWCDVNKAAKHTHKEPRGGSHQQWYFGFLLTRYWFPKHAVCRPTHTQLGVHMHVYIVDVYACSCLCCEPAFVSSLRQHA